MDSGNQTNLNQTASPEASSVSPSRVLILTVISDREMGLEEKVHRFDKDRVVIGSVISSDVRLVGPSVSPIHAVIERAREGSNDRVVIYDLASATGIRVNEEKVVNHPIQDGDLISVGKYRIQFSLEDGKRVSRREELIRVSEGRKLFLDPKEDLKPLVLESEEGVEEIFDFEPEKDRALEVVMSWKGSILYVEHFRSREAVTVGAGRKSDFVIPPILSSSRFPFVTSERSEFVLHLDDEMRGAIQRRGKVIAVEELRKTAKVGAEGYRIPLSESDFAKISIGEIDFYLSFSSPPPKLKKRKLFEKDPLHWKVLTASIAFTLVSIVALMNLKVSKVIEVEELPERVATILYQPEKYAYQYRAPRISTQNNQGGGVYEISKDTSKKGAGPEKLDAKIAEVPQRRGGETPSGEGRGARAKNTSGRTGDSNSVRSSKTGKKEVKRAASKKNTSEGAGQAKASSRQGGIDVLAGAQKQFLNLLGKASGRLGKSGSTLEGFGGFTSQGEGGLALSGDGSGGGGQAESIGGLSQKTGPGGGRVGTGLGATGTGSGIAGGRARVTLRAGGSEETVVLGAVDASAIEAALAARRDEFRLCYEREINAGFPNLAGRVSTNFVIGTRGRVTKAGIISSTLKNRNTERCILTVIKRISFPVPKGGGIVQVTYGFKFRPIANR